MKQCIICELQNGERIMPSLDIHICEECLALTKKEDIVLCFNCRSRYGFPRSAEMLSKIILSGIYLDHIFTKHGGKIIMSMFCPDCKVVKRSMS